MTTTPHLFFLPGVGADPGFWRGVGDRLPAAWGKTYFGWPGLGRQPACATIACFDDLADMVEAALGDAPVDILAQSMGGAIAMRLALRHPGRVRRIVLSVTAGGLDVMALGAIDWRESYALEFPQAAPWIYDARPDHAADLHRIAHPTLLVWGDADPISPVAVGRHLETVLPDARLHVVRGGGHGLIAERAEEVAPVIAAHLGAQS